MEILNSHVFQILKNEFGVEDVDIQNILEISISEYISLSKKNTYYSHLVTLCAEFDIDFFELVLLAEYVVSLTKNSTHSRWTMENFFNFLSSDKEKIKIILCLSDKDFDDLSLKKIMEIDYSKIIKCLQLFRKNSDSLIEYLLSLKIT